MKIELILNNITDKSFRLNRDLDEQTRAGRNGSFSNLPSQTKGNMVALNGISNGDQVQITLDNGIQKKFSVCVGDAALKGNENAIWLMSNEEGKNIYIRKLPQEPLSVGVALFNSKADLESTLNSGDFYIA